MEHLEAIEMMASERYLLDELTPELRDAYEEHFFGCEECALDVQLGAAFMDQAKIISPEMMSSAAAAVPASASIPAASVMPAAAASVAACDWPEREPVKQQRDWFAWLRPAMMVPAFACLSACLLAVVGYQNLVVYPALQAAATEPRIVPTATVLHDDTRSGIPVVYADLRLGTTIKVEMPSGVSYSEYKLEGYNSKGKLIWTLTVPGDLPGDAGNDGTLSFWLPSSIKQDIYKLAIGGITPAGQIVPVKQQVFALQVRK